MKLPLLAALGLALLADTSPRQPLAVRETSWVEGDWTVATNDKLDLQKLEGETVGLQIVGGGESALIRRRRYPLLLPCTVTWKVRVSNPRHGAAYPSLHLLLDPPPLEDAWWKAPIQPPAGNGRWAGGKLHFLFHFATDPGWRRAGMTDHVERGPAFHSFSPPIGEWMTLRATLERGRITMWQGQDKLYGCDADLSQVRFFAPAIGDQTSTHVELDELRIEAGIR